MSCIVPVSDTIYPLLTCWSAGDSSLTPFAEMASDDAMSAELHALLRKTDCMSERMREIMASHTASSSSCPRSCHPSAATFEGELRDYQLGGVEWLLSLHRAGLNGILVSLRPPVNAPLTACHMFHPSIHPSIYCRRMRWAWARPCRCWHSCACCWSAAPSRARTWWWRRCRSSPPGARTSRGRPPPSHSSLLQLSSSKLRFTHEYTLLPHHSTD